MVSSRATTKKTVKKYCEKSSKELNVTREKFHSKQATGVEEWSNKPKKAVRQTENKGKMADINPSVSTQTLNVVELNSSIKSEDCQTG